MLQSYQVPLQLDENPVVCLEKSRRIGGTFWLAIRAVSLCALPVHEGGMGFAYVCHRGDTTQTFMRYAAQFARGMNEIMGGTLIRDPREGKDIRRKQIDFANGNPILALSSNASAVRGAGFGTLAYGWDEAAHSPEADEVWEAIQATKLTMGRIFVTSTHFGEDTRFNKIIQDARSGKTRHSVHTVRLTDAVQQGFYRTVCEITGRKWTQENEEEYLRDALSEDGAEEEYLCVPAKVGANYFYKDAIESCMVREWRPLRLQLAHEFMGMSEESRANQIDNWFQGEVSPILLRFYNGYDAYYGQDFARSPVGDLSVVALLRLEEDMRRGCPLLLEMRGVPYKQQEQIAKRIARETGRLRHMTFDAGGNGNFLADTMQTHMGESMVTKLHINAKQYGELLPKLKSATESDHIRLPSSAELLGDFMKITRKEGVPVLPRTKESDGKGYRHGDTVVALMMAYSDSMSGGWFDYSPAPGYLRSRKQAWTG